MSTPPSRRERLRTATVSEIKDLARRLLVSGGPAAISLRAIAREMGMTAPALYRYFPSLDALITEIADDIYEDWRRHVEAAMTPGAEPVDQLVAMARAMRRWAVDHPADFGLILGNPLPGITEYDQSCGGRADSAAQLFGIPWILTFAEAWHTYGFPAPPHDLIVERLGSILTPAVAHTTDLPPEVLYTYLTAWLRIYGLIAMEVFGHLQWAVRSMEPLFETELALYAALLRGSAT